MKSLTILAGLLFFSLISCNNTKVVSSWKAPNASSKPYHKIMVLGIIHEKDRTLRSEIENQVVADLRDMGYDAVSALQEYGPKAFNKLGEEEIVQKLKESKYDAVLTTALINKQKDKHYTRGNVSYQPVGVAYNRFGRYYSTIYDRTYTPGYYTTSTNFFLESNFYDLDNGDLIYSVQGKTFNPSSSSNLSSDYSKKIVKDMRKKGVLSKQSS